MNQRQTSDLDQECEGIELLDDASDSSTAMTDPLPYLQHAKLAYRKAQSHWFSSHLETTARKANCERLRLANRLAPYVHGVSVWPVFVVYIVFVAGWLVLISALPFDLLWLPWIIRFGLLGALVLMPALLLLGALWVLRDARRDPLNLADRTADAMQGQQESAKRHQAVLLDLDQARANLRIAQLQAKLFRRNQAESQRSTQATLSELSLFTASLRWRYLTGETWEGYLEQIFLKNGYKVERTKVTGDQGVDLIVSFKRIRLAVQAKGYAGSVGNKAVQEVVAGRIYYQCTHSAVITNSSFTKSAQELATKTDCILIDRSGIERLHSSGLKHIVS